MQTVSVRLAGCLVACLGAPSLLSSSHAGLDKKVPQALVLTPTRELAQQILGVASEASEHVGHR